MLPLRLDPAALDGGFTLLVLGAHADDIEIGCGGTILRLAEMVPSAHVHWIVLSGDGERGAEAEASATDSLGDFASSKVAIERFRDGFFPYDGGAVKEYFETLKTEVSPDLVLTHQRADLHQDHRLVCELTWNTFRDQLVLEYEVPKWDGDFGSPNVFVPISEELAERKVQTLLRHFSSQRDKAWFTKDLFYATLRLRGMESNAASGLAEGFYGRKVVL
jgi:LmbE family N-acetylglucosaminyl deacetylase